MTIILIEKHSAIDQKTLNRFNQIWHIRVKYYFGSQILYYGIFSQIIAENEMQQVQ